MWFLSWINSLLRVKETIFLAYIDSEIFLLKLWEILAADKARDWHASLLEVWLYNPILHSLSFSQFITFDFEYGFYDSD